MLETTTHIRNTHNKERAGLLVGLVWLVVLGCSPSDSSFVDPVVSAAFEKNTLETGMNTALLDSQSSLISLNTDETSQPATALGFLNAIRQDLGLHHVDPNPRLKSAALGHAWFLANHAELYANGLSFHDEKEGEEGYIGTKYWDRQALYETHEEALGEVIAFQPTSEAAMTQWMESVYHRIPLVDARVTSAGYGEQESQLQSYNVLELATLPLANPEDAWIPKHWVAVPHDGATMVPTSWDGKESPQPPSPPGGFPSGPVFTLSYPDTQAVKVYDHRILDEQGNALEHMLLDGFNDPSLERVSALALYPNDPLLPNTQYTVAITGFRGEEDFYWVSTFTTASEEKCALLGPNSCGAGRGCYPSNGDVQCAWMGTQSEGEACVHQNDCARGTSCVDGQCLKLCSQDDGHQQACSRLCGEGFSGLKGFDQLGVCHAPACHPIHAQCENLSCTVGTTLSCQKAGKARAGEACSQTEDCESGSTCVSENGAAGQCLHLCAVYKSSESATLPWCEKRCPGTGHHLADHPGLGVCGAP